MSSKSNFVEVKKLKYNVQDIKPINDYDYPITVQHSDNSTCSIDFVILLFIILYYIIL